MVEKSQLSRRKAPSTLEKYLGGRRTKPAGAGSSHLSSHDLDSSKSSRREEAMTDITGHVMRN